MVTVQQYRKQKKDYLRQFEGVGKKLARLEKAHEKSVLMRAKKKGGKK